MPKKLVEILPEEISLVDKSSNKKKFYIIKREDKLTFEDIKRLYQDRKNDLDPEVRGEMEEAFNRLDEVRDDMTDELVESLEMIMAFAVSNFGGDEGSPYPKPYGYSKRDSRIFKEKQDPWPSL